MSLFSDNLRYLRENREETQSGTARSLDIKRSRYEPYESGKTEPPYEILKKLSRHFGISIDLLLSIDVRKYKIDELLKLDDNRIVLPIVVDQYGENLVEVVPHKTRAGYLTGYADPEYIGSLQKISLPFLGTGKFRAFPIDGDSMPPHNDDTYIIGRYVENLGEIRKNKTYIFITANDGMTYKRLDEKSDMDLTVKSDNIIYSPYKIRLSDIIEIWEFAGSMSTKEAEPNDLSDAGLKQAIVELAKAVHGMKR